MSIKIKYYSKIFKKWKHQTIIDEEIIIIDNFIYNIRKNYFNPIFSISDLTKIEYWDTQRNQPIIDNIYFKIKKSKIILTDIGYFEIKQKLNVEE